MKVQPVIWTRKQLSDIIDRVCPIDDNRLYWDADEDTRALRYYARAAYNHWAKYEPAATLLRSTIRFARLTMYYLNWQFLDKETIRTRLELDTLVAQLRNFLKVPHDDYEPLTEDHILDELLICGHGPDFPLAIGLLLLARECDKSSESLPANWYLKA